MDYNNNYGSDDEFDPDKFTMKELVRFLYREVSKINKSLDRNYEQYNKNFDSHEQRISSLETWKKVSESDDAATKKQSANIRTWIAWFIGLAATIFSILYYLGLI